MRNMLLYAGFTFIRVSYTRVRLDEDDDRAMNENQTERKTRLRMDSPVRRIEIRVPTPRAWPCPARRGRGRPKHYRTALRAPRSSSRSRTQRLEDAMRTSHPKSHALEKVLPTVRWKVSCRRGSRQRSESPVAKVTY